MKYKFIFVFMFLSCLITAQKVSNVTFRQEQSTIIISYDLETKTSCKISLFVSTDDGKTWQGPLKKVTGDAGAKIASGNHGITWNVLEEFEELRGDKIKFQIRADVGNIETVVIGTQEWTVKNLDVSRYRNGDIIPEVKDHKKWVELKTGAWCYYNNDPENGKIYGKLYNWYAVNDPRGLAPEGFHIPSLDELEFITKQDTLTTGKMKEIEYFENSFYKSKTKVGCLRKSDGFEKRTTSIYYWSSSEEDMYGIWPDENEHFTFASGLMLIFGHSFRVSTLRKSLGLYVRCLRD